MQYIQSTSSDPRWNLALEEFVFSHMDPTQEYFILWQNHNTIVIGKNQNTIAEINSAFVEEHDINELLNKEIFNYAEFRKCKSF